MKALLNKFSLFRQRTRRTSAASRVAVVHWDQDSLDYLIVSPKTTKIESTDCGRLSWSGSSNPLQALNEHWSGKADRPQRLVVLLSRPVLEQLSLNLPPAEAFELPALVSAAVEQHLGEGDSPPVVDFYAQVRGMEPPPALESLPANHQVLAFALAAQELDRIREWSQQSGWRLSAICSRELSPLGILRRQHIAANSLSISVHIISGEAELAVCRGADPVFLRLIRIAIDDPQRVAEQIWMETQRCLTILTADLAELPHTWYVFSTCNAALQVARSLEDRGENVQPVEPLFGWQLDGALRESPPNSSLDDQTSAANSGAAWDFLHGELPINLLSPKRAPAPPNPLHRWGAIAAALVAVVGLGVYLLLSDIGTLRAEIADLQSDLTSEKKLAAKFMEKADQVAYVETWLSDQVDWLAELNALSKRLPDGEQATVRRLTASASGKVASVDLSVQVAKQENIAQLESGIRGAKYQATSGRISENSESAEYPWQFETHISFEVEPPASDAYISAQVPITTKREEPTTADNSSSSEPLPVASRNTAQEGP